MKKYLKSLMVIFLFFLISCESNENEAITVVVTEEVSVYFGDAYIFSGTIVSIGDEEITDHGFCWCDSGDPDLGSSIISLGRRASTGNFSYTLSGFNTSTAYYVRAFVTSDSQIYYGDVKSFTTPESFPQYIVDIDKNIYSIVTIGDQTWMAENLKTRRYSDGTFIQMVEDQQAWYDFSMYASAYCWYDNNATLGYKYGAFYTWPAAMRVTRGDTIKPGYIQGVCPDGWHMPSDNEWKELEMYLGMSSTEAEKEGWRGSVEGGMLKDTGTPGWESPNTGATNQSGFTAIPSGWRDGAGYFKNMGSGARFWAASIRGDFAWMRELDYNTAYIYRGTKGLYYGHSVRCIKNK